MVPFLLPGSAAAVTGLGQDPTALDDQLYRFEALEIRELGHRLHSLLWPKESTNDAESGSSELPLVLLSFSSIITLAFTTVWGRRPYLLPATPSPSGALGCSDDLASYPSQTWFYTAASDVSGAIGGLAQSGVAHF